MKQLDYFSLRIFISDNKDIPSFKLRGYLGKKYKDYLLMHHHIDDKKLFFHYPLIQYKKINRELFLIGLQEGADVLKKIWSGINEIEIDNIKLPIYEKDITYKKIDTGIAKEYLTYRFISPYLPLNQKNYKDYITLNQHGRKEKLKSIIIQNIISYCKGIEYTVLDKIVVSDIYFRKVRTRLKGIEMTGFTGNFTVNFKLPAHIGLGKSTSRGFGTVEYI